MNISRTATIQGTYRMKYLENINTREVLRNNILQKSRQNHTDSPIVELIPNHLHDYNGYYGDSTRR